IVHRCRDRIDESLIGVWRKKYFNGGSGRDCSGYFDIQLDFAIPAIAASGRTVRGAFDRDSGHLRCRADPELLKIIVYVVLVIAPAQFDDPNGFAFPGKSARESVELGQL